MSQVLEFESANNNVIVEAHDSYHIFMHSDCISSQMSPKRLSARFFEYFDNTYLELLDSESGYIQGFLLPSSMSLRDVSRFFLGNYGFSPRQEGVVAAMPFKGTQVVDRISLSAGDDKVPFTFSLLRSNHIMIERHGFYGLYPAQKVGINTLTSLVDVSDLQITLSSAEHNISHISLYLKDSKQRFDQFLDKYRQPKH